MDGIRGCCTVKKGSGITMDRQAGRQPTAHPPNHRVISAPPPPRRSLSQCFAGRYSVCLLLWLIMTTMASITVFLSVVCSLLACSTQTMTLGMFRVLLMLGHAHTYLPMTLVGHAILCKQHHSCRAFRRSREFDTTSPEQSLVSRLRPLSPPQAVKSCL